MAANTFKYFGEITLSETTDVSDPCYDRDVWCRITVPTIPGTYKCFGWVASDGMIEGIMVVHLDVLNKDRGVEDELGEIGVDSGMAGFFDHKPDLEKDNWKNLLTVMRRVEDEKRERVYIDTLKELNPKYGGSFFTSAGYGDGMYPVFGSHKDENGRYGRLEIVFIGEEDEE